MQPQARMLKMPGEQPGTKRTANLRARTPCGRIVLLTYRWHRSIRHPPSLWGAPTKPPRTRKPSVFSSKARAALPGQRSPEASPRPPDRPWRFSHHQAGTCDRLKTSCRAGNRDHNVPVCGLQLAILARGTRGKATWKGREEGSSIPYSRHWQATSCLLWEH